MQALIFRWVDVIVTPSHYLKNVLTEFYYVEPSKIEVIHNAVEAENVNLGKKNGLICTIGRLTPWKSVDGIIKAMQKVIKVVPDSTLLIVGDGPERKKLEKFAKECRISEHIVFLGKKDHDEVLELLRRASLFVLNSKYEGLPHTVIEAMACKTPVVATDIRGIREVIENGTGLIVEVNNEDDLAEKIIYSLEEKEETRKRVKRAYKRVKQEFSWEVNLKKLERMFKRVSK